MDKRKLNCYRSKRQNSDEQTELTGRQTSTPCQKGEQVCRAPSCSLPCEALGAPSPDVSELQVGRDTQQSPFQHQGWVTLTAHLAPQDKPTRDSISHHTMCC